MVVCKNWPKYYNTTTAKSSTHPLRLGNDRFRLAGIPGFGFGSVSVICDIIKNDHASVGLKAKTCIHLEFKGLQCEHNSYTNYKFTF